jgi:hypothetical protein
MGRGGNLLELSRLASKKEFKKGDFNKKRWE